MLPQKVLAAANVNNMKLEAFKYYYAPAGALEVAGVLCQADTGNLEDPGGYYRRREAVHGGNWPYRRVHRTARRSGQ